MKLFFCGLLLLCPYLSTLSQPRSPTLQAINIGDKIPNVSFHDLFNSAQHHLQLSALKGKLVLLDFFATHCAPCVANLPHLDSLQHKFPGKLQVILINQSYGPDEKNRLLHFFQKRKSLTGKRFNLPIVLDGAVLDSMFPHDVIPYYVWINSDQKVIGVTESEEGTASNIESILAGNTKRLEARQAVSNVNYNEPFFLDGNGATSKNIFFRSLLSAYIPGLPAKCAISKPTDTTKCRLYYTNATAVMLYSLAYPFTVNFPRSHTKLEMTNPSDYDAYNADWDTWKFNHTYTYELIIPYGEKNNLTAIVRNDLHRYFKLAVDTEKREVTCWVLTKLVGHDTLSSTTGEQINNIWDGSDGPKFIHNQPLDLLCTYMNGAFDTPTINETGYTGNISIDFIEGIKNVTDIKNALHTIGLDLKEAKRTLTMLVFKDSYNDN